MSYTLSEAKRAELKKLASSSGLPYATILDQHIYDLKSLESVLTSQIERARAGGNDSQIAELNRKLKHCQEEIAAYEKEKNGALA